MLKDLIDKNKVEATLRLLFFENLEEIGDAYEIVERNRKVEIVRRYKGGIVIYDLVKLCMLEFSYDVLNKNVNQRNFEYVYMDTT